MFKNLGVDRSEEQLFLINELVQLNSGQDFAYDLEKHIDVLDLESGCLEEEVIEVVLSKPSSVTFTPNVTLNESQNELTYKLRTQEGLFVSLNLNTKETLANLIITDDGAKILNGRTMVVRVSKHQSGDIHKEIQIGNFRYPNGCL